MASVTSLGVHQPISLKHAIDEGILPPDAPPSSYTSDITVDKQDGVEYEDELLITENCVLWSRGGIFRKSFKSTIENETVTQALLTYFPTTADGQNAPEKPESSSVPGLPLSRALVVFLKTQAHIFFLSGTSHVVHMPFEVESACAAPCGIIIQRKAKGGSTGAMSLRMPRVPPNSFVSSQTSTLHPPVPKFAEFSTERLGKPKPLPLRLSSTLENMWQPSLETPDSRWPRLVCLTDPLLEIGLVVTQPDRPPTADRRRSANGSLFLNPADEILHIQEIKIGDAKMNLAVTVNREASLYTVWRLSYLEKDDPFIGKQKPTKPKSSRRRSSLAPGLASGTATPLHPPRESSGGNLPVKKTRKSVKIDEKASGVLDNALSSLDPEKGNDAARRRSGRVSSLLARADLSASQERTTFSEAPHPSQGGRRAESHGSQRGRLSGGFGAPGFSGTFNHSLISLTEAPVDNLLEELRAGGDFEGFHDMGLDDNDFDGLTHEMLLTKIHSVPMDNTNVRYSLSSQPARTQSKVFVLVGPPTATDGQGRTVLLVGLQDPVDKRLQLLTLYAEKKAGRKSDVDSLNVVFGELRRVQSVVDSCKLSDGEETVVILSEDKTGHRGLSLQSPWGKVTKISLPLLFLDNLNSLEYEGQYAINKEIRGRRSVTMGVSGARIETLTNPQSHGVVDLQDKDGKFHRVRIKLRPSSQQVRQALTACRSVLPSSYAERMLAGWWHVMQWLQVTKPGGLSYMPVDAEWAAFVILILSSFLALNDDSVKVPRSRASSHTKSAWETMQRHAAPNSAACPPWTRNKGWQWMLDKGVLEPSSDPEQMIPRSFMSIHTDLAKEYLKTADGLVAFGPVGYLPTAAGKDRESRETAAWSMMLALHLLLEEQRLSILAPEETSPGSTELRALLCHLANWLNWAPWHQSYKLGMQADSDDSDRGKLVTGGTFLDRTNTKQGYCISGSLLAITVSCLGFKDISLLTAAPSFPR